MLGIGHERSKSNLKTFGDSVVQTSESLKRSLLNFRSDLLGLQHNERYSAETENLVKLIQKYVDKLAKIEQRYKLKKCLEKRDESKSTTRHVSSRLIRPGANYANNENSNFDEFFENENFADIISQKDKKYTDLHHKYTSLVQRNNKLLQRFVDLETENKEMSRKLAINDNHEQLEVIFGKLSALILSNRKDADIDLNYKEREMVKDLFGSKIILLFLFFSLY